ncbi:MAG TPA: IS66 family transposase [Ktedonobacterales bacterium]|jgi:transposase|nr:IS66 family transposase [Ktedonobacterales bacterium]
MTDQEQIAALQAENATLREQLTAALAEIRDLQARLSKDSRNSSKPPSSDGLKRQLPRTRSLRRKSGKKPGGQLGHRGETLHLVAEPDVVIEHRPSVCATCQTSLEPITAAEVVEVVARERRQVQDLPPIRLQITEHQALSIRCPACQQVTVGAFPVEAPSRAQYGPQLRALAVYLVAQQFVPYARARDLLADLTGARLSVGTLVAWVQQSAEAVKPVEAALKVALHHAPVLHSDETGVRRNGRLAWAHVASTARLTHYAIHAKRGSEATDAVGILPDYRGVSVHDGWKPYQAQTACRHALCNVHHLRELTFVEEQYQQPWAKDLKALLLAMRTATEQARAHGQARLATPQRDTLVARYEQLLALGLAANPPPPRRLRQRGRVKQSPVRNLLERLWLGQAEVLAFLDDLTIPFDNNQAERDLRLLKTQQKIAGCFRSDAGAEAFARLRGYLSTLRKQCGSVLDALRTLFTATPLYPALA